MSIQSDLLGAVNSIAGFALGARSVKKMDESNKRLDKLKEALDLQTKNLEETQKRLSSLEMGEKPKVLVDERNNPYKTIRSLTPEEKSSPLIIDPSSLNKAKGVKNE